jgi:hypothetical protein
MHQAKRLLLGTAAVVVGVTGAQAADIPVKATPVQYVKICSLYGDGFYYVPGTNSCLKLGGYVRVQTEYNAGGGGVVDGALSQATQAMYDRVRTNDVDFRVRGVLSLDVRDQTEYGTLRSYFRIGIQQTTPADGPGGAVFWDRAFIQWAGFTIGKAQSFYDTVSHAAYTYTNQRTGSDTSDIGWNVWAYTAHFGYGFSATLSLEDPNRGRSVVDVTQASFLIPAAVVNDNAFGLQSATNNGMRMPDVIFNLRLDQGWGNASASFAIHDVAGAYFGTPNNVNNGHPTDVKGWAVSAGAELKLSGNDVVGINGQYSVGASAYGAERQIWSILNPGTSIGVGWSTDGVFDTGTEIELTRVWSIIAYYQHIWNPQWRTSWYGGYVQVEYNDAATDIINSHLPGAPGTIICGVPVVGVAPFVVPITLPPGGGGNSCNPDLSVFQIGTRTQWNPHPLLDIGVEIIYTRLNTAYKGPTAPAGVDPGLPQNPVSFIDDQDVLSALFRWQRNFYP